MELIEKAILDLGLKGMILDGEIKGDNWNSTISIVHTETERTDKGELFYHIFDCITLLDWETLECSVPYSTRKIKLVSLLPEPAVDNCLRIVPHQETNGTNMWGQYQSLLKQGYEGAVLKEASSVYPFGRTKSWLKWKPVYSIDVTICGFEEGEGRNKGKLGAFFIAYNGVESKVGSGYNDEERTKFWNNRDNMLGKIIEVEYRAFTVDSKLLFPSFKRLRIDR